MTKYVKLKEAIDILREQGVEVSMGTFDDYDCFMSYYEHHYKPCLEKYSFEDKLKKNPNIFMFFCEDIMKIFE